MSHYCVQWINELKLNSLGKFRPSCPVKPLAKKAQTVSHAASCHLRGSFVFEQLLRTFWSRHWRYHLRGSKDFQTLWTDQSHWSHITSHFWPKIWFFGCSVLWSADHKGGQDWQSSSQCCDLRMFRHVLTRYFKNFRVTAGSSIACLKSMPRSRGTDHAYWQTCLMASGGNSLTTPFLNSTRHVGVWLDKMIVDKAW